MVNCSVSFTHLSDHQNKHYDFNSITGIPPYIQVLVGQDYIIHDMKSNFTSYHDKMVNELNRREFGNGLTIDLICD